MNKQELINYIQRLINNYTNDTEPVATYDLIDILQSISKKIEQFELPNQKEAIEKLIKDAKEQNE